MLGETYETLNLNNNTIFIFESVGPKGIIPKIVVFQERNDGKWNLGFGDYLNGGLNDKVISNNSDIRKVMFTVAETIYTFTETYPDKIVFIQPVDKRRGNLYNLIFQKRWNEIKDKFHILGEVNGRRTIYDPSLFFETFELQLK